MGARVLAGDLGAEGNGFQARCRPVIRQIGLTDSSPAHVNLAIRWIRENFAEPMRIEDLARLSGLSKSAFRRNFAPLRP